MEFFKNNVLKNNNEKIFSGIMLKNGHTVRFERVERDMQLTYIKIKYSKINTSILL